jgi:hypothetical protein
MIPSAGPVVWKMEVFMTGIEDNATAVLTRRQIPSRRRNRESFIVALSSPLWLLRFGYLRGRFDDENLG